MSNTLGTIVNKALGGKHGHDEKDGNFVVVKKGWHNFVNAFREKAGSEFAVKGRIIEGVNAEFLWLIVDSIDDMKVHGQLDNQPSTVMNLKMGQDLHIPVANVDDWIYLNKEKNVGGFTIKAFDQLAQPKPKH